VPLVRDDLIHVIREFTGTIINPFDLDELLHRLMQHATEVVGAAGAGVMLADLGGQLSFVAASDARVVDAEQRQAQLRSGACFEAYTVNAIVVAEDLGREDRWPDYARHVLDLGLRSVLGVPMNAFGRTVGVINVYREQPGPWSKEDVGAAEIITAMGAGYLTNANQLRQQHQLAEQLRGAIESRDVIGQAKGILMARNGVSADDAFDRLRRLSQQRNRKLREVAQGVIDDQHERGADG
jgi:GAF domain-containing protein